MRNIFIISIVLLSFFQFMYSEESTGEVVLYVFSLGKPTKDMRVVFNEKTVEFTDESGAARAVLNAGTHKVKVTGDKKVVAVAEFLVAAGESTRIIISAKNDGTNSEVEIEHPEGSVEKVDENINKNLTPGVFSGVVTSLVDKSVVPQVSIFIKGIKTRIVTDESGAFKTELPPGSYAVSFIHAQFSTQTVEGIEIREGLETVKNIELTPASIELDEYVVLVPHIQGGIASLMEERRESSAVSDVIGAEQMSKSGDSNAASALKRVTGLTVVGGKYVYVRGMGERYSSTLLNGSTLPSPEPEKRVVPLDIFPTGILQSVEVQKTFTPDMPGEFGGGVIKIKTKGIPEKFTASLSLSAGFADDSFSTGMSYKGGKYDWLGIDDGSRDIPKEVLDATKGGIALKEKDKYSKEGFTKEEMESLGESFPNRWNTHETMILPDLGFSLTLGDRWKLSDVSFGLLGSFSYSNGMETKQVTTNSYGYTGDDLAAKSRYTYDITTNDIKMGSILEAGLDIGKHTKIGNTLLVLRTTEDTVSVAEGYNFEIGDNTKTTKLRWTEQMLISEQIRGTHKIAAAGDLGFDWRYTFSRAEMKMPDSRHYRYDFYPEDDAYLLTKTTKSNERAFTYLADNNHDFGFDINKPFKIYKDLDLKLKTGFNLVAKDRAVDTRRFGYKIKNRDPEYTSGDMESILSQENIGSDGAVIGEITRNTDNYIADQLLLAGFFMFDWEIWKGLVLTAGMRYERSDYSVKTYELYATNPEIIESPLKSDDFLPAVSLIYKLPHDMQIRAGYSLTVNRPSLKELSPAMMDDVEGGGETLGNPELKQADIHSVDFRYEWYFSTMESLSAAFFFKHFEKPIEQVYTDASGESKTFKNGKSAMNLGVELEARKNFGFIHDSLEELFLAGNLSYIYSVVDVENEDERPLQGQSPWIINLQLGYDNSDIGTSVSILYNMFGERLDTLAVTGPHAWEQPWHQLDFVASQTFKHGFKLSFKATNLIDLPVEVYYEGDGIKKIRSTYKKGREFSVGLGWSY
ncbi:MAG TPA: TonB-dependent receptor [bacterium]|nr:TonB-dependent receptor [bacterium]